MKKVLMIIMLLSSFSIFASGARPCSDRYENRVTKTANTVAFVLNCTNKEEVRKSVDRVAKKLRFCRSDKGVVCYLAGKTAAYLVKRSIPLRWECKPDIAMTVISMTVNQVCSATTGL